MALDSQMSKSSELADPFFKRDPRANVFMEKHVTGVAGPASLSLPRALEHDLGVRSNFSLEPSYFMEGNKMNLIGGQGENGLFSSSLSELFSRKCMFFVSPTKLLMLLWLLERFCPSVILVATSCLKHIF